MGKHRYDHRVLGFELPAGRRALGGTLYNPTKQLVERKIGINGRRATRTKPLKISERSRLKRTTSGELVDLYFERMKLESSRLGGSTGMISFQDNSLNAAIAMLHNKAKVRETNKINDELEDVRDRMVDVRIPFFSSMPAYGVRGQSPLVLPRYSEF